MSKANRVGCVVSATAMLTVFATVCFAQVPPASIPLPPPPASVPAQATPSPSSNDELQRLEDELDKSTELNDLYRRQIDILFAENAKLKKQIAGMSSGKTHR